MPEAPVMRKHPGRPSTLPPGERTHVVVVIVPLPEGEPRIHVYGPYAPGRARQVARELVEEIPDRRVLIRVRPLIDIDTANARLEKGAG